MSLTIADFCQGLPISTLEAGSVLLEEGKTSGRLFVLIEGTVEVVKDDVHINVVSDRGAIFGEMSALLDHPHMATVRTLTRCMVYSVEDADAYLREHQEIAYLISKILAQRLDGVTSYLVDLKHQFEDQKNHLGMVDEVLESLLHQQRRTFTPGSDRDPG